MCLFCCCCCWSSVDSTTFDIITQFDVIGYIIKLTHSQRYIYIYICFLFFFLFINIQNSIEAFTFIPTVRHWYFYPVWFKACCVVDRANSMDTEKSYTTFQSRRIHINKVKNIVEYICNRDQIPLISMKCEKLCLKYVVWVCNAGKAFSFFFCSAQPFYMYIYNSEVNFYGIYLSLFLMCVEFSISFIFTPLMYIQRWKKIR